MQLFIPSKAGGILPQTKKKNMRGRYHKVHMYLEHHNFCPLVGIVTHHPSLASKDVPPVTKGVGSPDSDDLRKNGALCLLCGGGGICIYSPHFSVEIAWAAGSNSRPLFQSHPTPLANTGRNHASFLHPNFKL